ncbi:hypothetical protein BC829DRAFT_226831 [Chytridium lagenaria]|nr:hypothetical protein BC829DRAFT_226831 [Chytridium lagenaria]
MLFRDSIQPGKVILLGHSLGASLILTTLKLMSESNMSLIALRAIDTCVMHRPRVVKAMLFGCASAAGKGDWDMAAKAVEGWVFNFYSKHDDVLQALGWVSKGGGRAGNEPAISRSGKVINVECEEVMTHGDWKCGIDVERLSGIEGLQ